MMQNYTPIAMPSIDQLFNQMKGLDPSQLSKYIQDSDPNKKLAAMAALNSDKQMQQAAAAQQGPMPTVAQKLAQGVSQAPTMPTPGMPAVPAQAQAKPTGQGIAALQPTQTPPGSAMGILPPQSAPAPQGNPQGMPVGKAAGGIASFANGGHAQQTPQQQAQIAQQLAQLMQGINQDATAQVPKQADQVGVAAPQPGQANPMQNYASMVFATRPQFRPGTEAAPISQDLSLSQMGQYSSAQPIAAAHGGLMHHVPDHMYRFKQGGILAFPTGGQTNLTNAQLAAVNAQNQQADMDASSNPPSAAQQAQNQQLQEEHGAFMQGLGNLGAAAKDIVTLPGRAVAGVLNTGIRGARAVTGENIPYIFGNDPNYTQSMTPFTDQRNPDAPSRVPAAMTNVSTAPAVSTVPNTMSPEAPAAPTAAPTAASNPPTIIQKPLNLGAPPAAKPPVTQATGIASGSVTSNTLPPPSGGISDLAQKAVEAGFKTATVEDRIDEHARAAKKMGVAGEAGDSLAEQAQKFDDEYKRHDKSMEHFIHVLNGIARGGLKGGGENEEEWMTNQRLADQAHAEKYLDMLRQAKDATRGEKKADLMAIMKEIGEDKKNAATLGKDIFNTQTQAAMQHEANKVSEKGHDLSFKASMAQIAASKENEANRIAYEKSIHKTPDDIIAERLKANDQNFVGKPYRDQVEAAKSILATSTNKITMSSAEALLRSAQQYADSLNKDMDATPEQKAAAAQAIRKYQRIVENVGKGVDNPFEGADTASSSLPDLSKYEKKNKG